MKTFCPNHSMGTALLLSLQHEILNDPKDLSDQRIIPGNEDFHISVDPVLFHVVTLSMAATNVTFKRNVISQPSFACTYTTGISRMCFILDYLHECIAFTVLIAIPNVRHVSAFRTLAILQPMQHILF